MYTFQIGLAPTVEIPPHHASEPSPPLVKSNVPNGGMKIWNLNSDDSIIPNRIGNNNNNYRKKNILTVYTDVGRSVEFRGLFAWNYKCDRWMVLTDWGIDNV